MGETLLPVTMGFNRSLRIESRVDRLTGDPGAVLLREIVEQSGIIGWMTARLTDPRSQVDVTHDLASGDTGVEISDESRCVDQFERASIPRPIAASIVHHQISNAQDVYSGCSCRCSAISPPYSRNARVEGCVRLKAL